MFKVGAVGVLALALACGCSAKAGGGEPGGKGGTSWSGSGGGGEGGSGEGGAGAGASGGEGGSGAGAGSGGQGGAGGSGGQGGSGTAPSVVATSPADGTTAVAAGETVSVTFSEPMSAATITTHASSTCSGSVQLSADGFVTCVPISGAPASSDDVTFELTPEAPLSSLGVYRVRVTTAATDAGGAPLAAAFTSSTGFAVRYFRTVGIDGANDFSAGEVIASSTAGATLYVGFDEATLYLGLAHPDVQSPGVGNKFVYFLFSTDPALATGNALSSDSKAKFGAAGTRQLGYHWKERIDGPSYSEYRIGSPSDWSADWGTGGKSAFRAAGYLEGSIALSELGNPSQLYITAFTVDYTGDGGNGWVYNMLAGGTDGTGVTPRDLVSYLPLDFPADTAPSGTPFGAF